MTAVIATAHSKGGRLDCGHRVAAGELIVKIDAGIRGDTTSAGNGRGLWVCVDCAGRDELNV